MQPILYSSVNCPHSSKAAFFLAEKGVDFRRVEVSLGRGEQKTPAYLAINPGGTVPAYEDHQGVIGDSLAIMRYVDEWADGTRLFPTSPDKLQQAHAWVQRADTDFWDVSHHLYWQLIEPPASGTDWAEVARLKAKGRQLLHELDTILRDQPFVLGDFSVADVVLLPWVYGYQRFQLPETGTLPHVEAWRDGLAARSTFQANYNQIGEPLADFLAAHGRIAGKMV